MESKLLQTKDIGDLASVTVCYFGSCTPGAARTAGAGIFLSVCKHIDTRNRPSAGYYCFEVFCDSAPRHVLAGTFSAPLNVTEKHSRATSAFADRLSTDTHQRAPITPSQEVAR
jgi:hypothetical protein